MIIKSEQEYEMAKSRLDDLFCLYIRPDSEEYAESIELARACSDWLFSKSDIVRCCNKTKMDRNHDRFLNL